MMPDPAGRKTDESRRTQDRGAPDGWLIAAASVLIAVYVLRLIFLQLVNSDSFKAQATNTTDYNFTVTAARGDIVDSAGRRIAASTTSYNVVLSKLLMGGRRP